MMKAEPPAITKHRPMSGTPIQPTDPIPVDSIREELEKILASLGFAQSQRISRFLRFVVDQSLQGEGDKLKEYHVGTAVFDKDDSFDPRTDPIVRVEAGRLRSKLKDYYGAEGRDDRILIELPKGSYAPLIQWHSSSNDTVQDQAAGKPRRWQKIVPFTSLLLTFVVACWTYFEFRQNQALISQLERTKSEQAGVEVASVWRPFLAPGSRNFVVFGSPTFFASPQFHLFLRPYAINDTSNLLSSPELQTLRERLGPLEGPRHDYTLLRDALALQRLTAFLIGHGGHLTAVAAHEAVWDTIQDGNIIFLGAPRMNPLMKQFPFRQDFEWDADNNLRNLRPQAGEESLYTTPSHEETLSYVVIASSPGVQAKNEILLLMSQGGAGTQAVVDFLTRPEAAGIMAEKLQLKRTSEHKHFQMLLRIFVRHGIPIKTEYVTQHWVP